MISVSSESGSSIALAAERGAEIAVLHLEDSELDAELSWVRLRRAGVACRITRVDTREAFEEALRQRRYDLILSDFALPGFDGEEALEIAGRAAPETPFIFVSGKLGEEVAIDTLKRGATDYVLKQRLDRLVPAVRRALADVAERAERRRVEEELRYQSTLAQTIVRNATSGLFLLDPQGRVTFANAAAERMCGFPLESARGRSLGELLRPVRDGAPARDAFLCPDPGGRSSGSGAEQPVREELSLERRDGTRFPGVCVVSPVRPGGSTTGLLVEIRDATEERSAQEALRESERRFRSMAENAPVFVWTAAPDGRCDYVNRTWREFTGWSETAAAEGIWESCVHPDDLLNFRATYWSAVRGRQAFRMRYRIRRADGQYRWILDQGVPCAGPSGAYLGFVGSCSDITELELAREMLERSRGELERLVEDRTRELERSHQQLRLAERMAAVGTLSAGLGHDMGNLLMPIRMRLDAIEPSRLDPETREDVLAIGRCVEHLQRLATGLRLFTLDPADLSASGESVSPAEWWEEVQPFLKHAVPPQIALEADLPPELPRLAVPRHLLTQAVGNLVQNAGDALGNWTPPADGGAGSEGARHRPTVRVWAREAGEDAVVLGVSDNGPGMSPEVRGRCLEPFFTTKTRQFSTGLGLALVHGVVRSVRGAIEVQTEPGRGTSFLLTLPVVADPRRPVPEPVSPPCAVVTLADVRRAAYVVSVLRGAGIVARVGEPGCDLSDADLWVSDSRGGVPADVSRFLSAEPHRRAVVLTDLPGEDQAPERAAVLRIDAPSAEVREALTHAARAVVRARRA